VKSSQIHVTQHRCSQVWIRQRYFCAWIETGGRKMETRREFQSSKQKMGKKKHTPTKNRK